MSSDSSGAGRREVAYRLFAAEYDDATVSYSESDEERAPNYVISPTGGRVNRLFLVGVLTEVERVNEEMLRARIADLTGAFVVYAGQYQPDALAFLERAEPPTFLAVTGKARTFRPEDSDRVFTSVRPESISEVDAGTRDRWVVQTAEQTLDRVATTAAAERTGLGGEQLREALEAEGVDEGQAHGVALALQHYGTTGAYLRAVREVALDAVRVVADERDEVRPLSLAPDEGSDDDLEALAGEVGVSGLAAQPDGEPPVAATTGESSVETTTESTEEPAESVEAAEPATESGTEPAEVTQEEQVAGEPEEVGDFEPGEFDLDEETRQQVEEEHGVEFETGTEVGDPGEADIETPEPETGTEAEAESGAEAPVETETGTEAESEAAEPEPDEAEEAGVVQEEAVEEEAVEEKAEEIEETERAEEAEEAEEPEAEAEAAVDLADAVMEAMQELSDGGAADRAELVAAVVDQYGASESEVEDAIQDALMSGQCYEPDDGKLKPI